MLSCIARSVERLMSVRIDLKPTEHAQNYALAYLGAIGSYAVYTMTDCGCHGIVERMEE